MASLTREERTAIGPAGETRATASATGTVGTPLSLHTPCPWKWGKIACKCCGRTCVVLCRDRVRTRVLAPVTIGCSSRLHSTLGLGLARMSRHWDISAFSSVLSAIPGTGAFTSTPSVHGSVPDLHQEIPARSSTVQ
jgi:hypothetical protein